jgi:hypothetical protein
LSYDLVAANIFILLYLLLALFWDSPEINLLHKLLKSRAAWLVKSAGLDHAWTMYMGPFVSIAQLETWVHFADGAVEEFHPPRLYEFRRYYLLAAIHHAPPLSKAYLRYVRRQLEFAPRVVGRIEVRRIITPSPARVGGWLGRFEIQPEVESTATVVAVWERS